MPRPLRVGACAALLACVAAPLGAQPVRPSPAAVAQPAPRLALFVAGNLGRAPDGAFGGVVTREVRAVVLEYERALLGSMRAGVAWTPAVHPWLSVSGVPTADALIFFDCATAETGPPGRCTAQWSEQRTSPAIAIEPFALRAWRRVGRVELALRPGIGAAFFSRASPIPEARRLNALLRLDAELAAPLSARDRLVVRYGWWHMSNAGSAALNPGVDALQLQLGITRSLGRR